MGRERRRYARLVRPLDGTWYGRSGPAPCRITDISWGGCFVDSRTTPSMLEATVVSLGVGGDAIEIAGRVVSVDQEIGFAVQFDALTAEQVRVMMRLLGDPPAAEAQLVSPPLKVRR